MRHRLVGHFGAGDAAGVAEADQQRGGQGAGPQPALLAPAGEQRLQPDPRPAPDIQCADPFGSVELMAADRQQVDAHGLHVERDFPDCLRCVGVEQRAGRRAMAAASAMSWMMPVSLFTAITLTSRVGTARDSRRISGSSRPSGPTGSTTGSKPSRARSATDSRTHLCSVATVTMRRRGSSIRRAWRAAPLIARLLLSVAPLVKTISRGSAPIRAATSARAVSTAASAWRPMLCSALCGLPNCSVNQGSIAATTRGSQGVVAWLSR